jgi:hypothetical protein
LVTIAHRGILELARRGKMKKRDGARDFKTVQRLQQPLLAYGVPS